MIRWLRYGGAFFAGMIVTALLAVAVEILSLFAHPLPEGFGGTPGEIARHVELFPAEGLAVAALLWGVAAIAGVWTAARLGNRGCGLVVGLFALAAVLYNISLLPYPLWFEVASVLVVLLATALGYRYAGRRRAVQ